VLTLKDLTFSIRKDGNTVNLVDEVNIDVPRGHFMAIVGPSGCGKTTLLRTIAGLNEESSGEIYWNERNLCDGDDFDPSEIGYVPQFSIAYDHLTVDESIEAVAKLRLKGSSQQINSTIDYVLKITGLEHIADRKIKVLSGGQKRRIGLAIELVSSPDILLCDEVTSGLDPRSEREIVHLLHHLSRKEGRIVISVTHSLAHLDLYDSILVLHEGSVVYHGPPQGLIHYFSVEDSEEIYPSLMKRPGRDWTASWNKRKSSYYEKVNAERDNHIEEGRLEPPTKDPIPPAKAPGLMSQFCTLLIRRWKIFFRDRTQVLLQLAIIIGFPLLITLFSAKGQEPIRKYSDTRSGNIALQIEETQTIRADQVKVGSAVSGIIMFEVILLALMGSNNAAREVASERQIFEKEKFGGLSPSAYLMSKLAFLSCLVLAQSLFMAYFVEFFWGFRGNFTNHATFLILVNAAMTSICLGISSLMKTAEQASLLSIYLVGFQLPLSGAVLALPETFEQFTRPIISAYWAWSGSVDSLTPAVGNAVRSVSDTSLSGTHICFLVLGAHIAVGIALSWMGTRHNQWD